MPIDPSKGFWQFSSPTATLNGETIQRPPGNTAIADTGTTLALVDDALYEKIHSTIPGAVYDKAHQGWTFSIGTKISDLPTLALAAGDKEFEVQKEDFGFAKCGAGMQYGGIQSRGKSEFDIFGDTWLKGVYAIFDQGRKRFGTVQRVEGMQNLAVLKWRLVHSYVARSLVVIMVSLILLYYPDLCRVKLRLRSRSIGS